MAHRKSTPRGVLFRISSKPTHAGRHRAPSIQRYTASDFNKIFASQIFSRCSAVPQPPSALGKCRHQCYILRPERRRPKTNFCHDSASIEDSGFNEARIVHITVNSAWIPLSPLGVATINIEDWIKEAYINVCIRHTIYSHILMCLLHSDRRMYKPVETGNLANWTGKFHSWGITDSHSGR